MSKPSNTSANFDFYKPKGLRAANTPKRRSNPSFDRSGQDFEEYEARSSEAPVVEEDYAPATPSRDSEFAQEPYAASSPASARRGDEEPELETRPAREDNEELEAEEGGQGLTTDYSQSLYEQALASDTRVTTPTPSRTTYSYPPQTEQSPSEVETKQDNRLVKKEFSFNEDKVVDLSLQVGTAGVIAGAVIGTMIGGFPIGTAIGAFAGGVASAVGTLVVAGVAAGLANLAVGAVNLAGKLFDKIRGKSKEQEIGSGVEVEAAKGASLESTSQGKEETREGRSGLVDHSKDPEISSVLRQASSALEGNGSKVSGSDSRPPAIQQASRESDGQGR